MSELVRWLDASWVPQPPPTPAWIELLDGSPPVVRDGLLVPAVAQDVAEVAPDSWGEVVVVPGWRRVEVLSVWLLRYAVGGFAALHADRPDSDFTGLLALDPVPLEPVVLCPDLADRSPVELCEVAIKSPHPPGVEIHLRKDRLLAIPGSRVPHHRPPARRAAQVISLSLRVLD
jgi:hypothetical protein